MGVHGMAMGLFAGSLAGFVLGFLPLWLGKGGKVHRGEEYFFILTSGLFLGSVFAVIADHALDLSVPYFTCLAIGVTGSWLLGKRKLSSNPCCSPCHSHWDLSVLSVFAIAFCSLNDGVFVGVVQPGVFSILYASMFLHKFSVSLILAHFFRQSLLPVKVKVLLGAFFLMLTPLVIYGADSLTRGMRSLVDPLLGLSSGVLIYVMISGIVPTLAHYRAHRNVSTARFYALFTGALALGTLHLWVHAH